LSAFLSGNSGNLERATRFLDLARPSGDAYHVKPITGFSLFRTPGKLNNRITKIGEINIKGIFA